MDVAWYRIAPVSCWVSRSMSRNGSKRMTMCDHLPLAEVSLSAGPPVHASGAGARHPNACSIGEGRRRPRENVVAVDVGAHGLQAAPALRLAHRERLLYPVRETLLVEWVAQDGLGELLGGAGKLAQDEDATPLRGRLADDVLFGYQVHPVLQGRDQGHFREEVVGKET